MLACEEVTFGYTPSRPVLRAASASFAPGRVTAVVGPNGAGKSTLLRLLAGLREPRSGHVTLDRSSLRTLHARERARRLVFIPQQSSVAFAYAAIDVVRMGTYATGSNPSSAAAALARVGLSDRSDEPFAHLSAGQQQRITLARALAQLSLPEPTEHPAPDRPPPAASQYLLADEPVSAMDPNHALGALEILRSLASRSVGVVVVLHDLSLVLRYADDVLLLAGRGAVAAAGPCRETLTPASLRALFGIEFESLTDHRARPAALIPADA
jgi:iron complex transport system ATP-binding protein